MTHFLISRQQTKQLAKFYIHVYYSQNNGSFGCSNDHIHRLRKERKFYFSSNDASATDKYANQIIETMILLASWNQSLCNWRDKSCAVNGSVSRTEARLQQIQGSMNKDIKPTTKRRDIYETKMHKGWRVVSLIVNLHLCKLLCDLLCDFVAVCDFAARQIHN